MSDTFGFPLTVFVSTIYVYTNLTELLV